MGCCESAPNDDVLNSSQMFFLSLTSAENLAMNEALSNMPDRCRPAIIDLPARPFLHFYKLHLDAVDYVKRREFFFAGLCERQALVGIAALMPNNKGHFIFAEMCHLLSQCYLELNAIDGAIYCARVALGIFSRNCPTKHAALSKKYFRLALALKAGQEWGEAIACLNEALRTARLSNELDQAYIRMLETDLVSTKQHAMNHMLANVTITIREVQPYPEETSEDFDRRITAEMIAYNAANGTLAFDKVEFERLPDKQTESQIDDEIFKNVLRVLEHYLKSDDTSFCRTSSSQVQFIAAQFKNTQMKETLWSPAVIEAALTMIIDRMNNENMDSDERYAELKQSPLAISYIDNSDTYTKGVRVFTVKKQ